jgi:hypothetical protein
LGIKNITRMRYNVYKIFFDINIPLKWNFEWTRESYSSVLP